MQPYPGKKKEKCEVLSSFSINSSYMEFVQITNEKGGAIFQLRARRPQPCLRKPFHCRVEITAERHRSASLCLCKVTSRFCKVHVIYCSHEASLCMYIEGKSS